MPSGWVTNYCLMDNREALVEVGGRIEGASGVRRVRTGDPFWSTPVSTFPLFMRSVSVLPST
jgi:hypothetical protein